ncbi:MAG TPA: hypothetical protein VKA64_09840 [Gammaproteobacteria bacterium]|nr:hypothetical protein [Gammaproteobacteria bacterium]
MDDFIIVWGVFALLTTWVASRKGETVEGLLIGVLLGPLGLLIAMLSPGRRPRPERANPAAPPPSPDNLLDEEKLMEQQKPATLFGKKGLLSPEKVKLFAFVVITLCLIISATVAIMAIWDYADRDVLWRTVATCLVLAGAVAAFAVINTFFGQEE